MNKTTQALKITASWTPSGGVAAKMIATGLKGTMAAKMAVSGGRLTLKHAIKIDYTDPAQAVRVSERVAAIKAELEGAGTLHGFAATAGSVPIEEAEVLAEPDTAEAAK